ncbi:unnamed protein product [Urochloa decumbens]|uniref:Chitinase n=1 Tax=Urochloa decumbens TaxID=240449 RepID=A0ABC9ANA2_9POAL
MTNGYLFREYIGAQFTGVQFSDVPINAFVSFHFILSFAIDYTPVNQQNPPVPTNGVFTPFWDTANLSPSAVAAIMAVHRTAPDGAEEDHAMAHDVDRAVRGSDGPELLPAAVEQFYDQQSANYPGGKVLASFKTGDTTGLISPDLGISAAQELQRQNKLLGLFIWSADSSKKSSYGFKYETDAQQIIANH